MVTQKRLFIERYIDAFFMNYFEGIKGTKRPL